MRLAIFICLAFLQNIFFVASVHGQKSELKKADILFNAGKYESALTAYNNYNKTNKKPDLLIKRGICYLNTNQPDLSIADMQKAGELKSRDDRRFNFIGKALMDKGKYEQAASYFKIYLNTTTRYSSEWHQTINQIKKCGFARNGNYMPQIAFVENMGSMINTKHDEISPRQSPNNLFRYYFSAAKSGSIGGLLNDQGYTDPVKGKYTSDIYYSELIAGNWSSVQSLSEAINSPAHEIIEGFSDGGQIMYFTRKPLVGKASLMSDTFSVDKTQTIFSESVTTLPYKPEFGDKNLYFFNDSTILFSAIRDFGYGGYDLYFSVRKSGFWTLPVNMGSEINSVFDEVAPYLTKDGKTLYYSSDRNESYGGFDVFTSSYNNYHWKKPENLGLPVNSPGDDLDFQVSTDGTMAILASNRLSSLGGFDLYVCYFKDQILEQFDIADIPDFMHDAALPKDEIATRKENIEQITSQPIVKKDLILRSIVFNEDEELLNSGNQTYLKNLANVIVIYPKTKIIIQSHTLVSGKPEIDLFFSLKRAETVAEQLVKSGIKREHIFIQGFGSNYPMVQYYHNNQPNKIAQTINKRIDIRLILEDQTPLNLQYNWPAVVDAQLDTKWQSLLESFNDNIVFKIKFAETAQMLKNELTTSDYTIIVEKYANNTKNVYTVGQYNTWMEAKTAQNRLLSHNVFNTTIVPYQNGIQMTQEAIIENQNKYPELAKYLKESR